MLFVCACIHACMAHICVCVHVRACVYACVSVWKFITDFYNWWNSFFSIHTVIDSYGWFLSREHCFHGDSLHCFVWSDWWTSKRKRLSHAAVFRWYPWTRGQFLQASLLCHRPHRAWSVTGTFYKREVGIPWGGCSGADFTEISKFPEIQGELNMRKQCVPGSFFLCPYTRAWERG